MLVRAACELSFECLRETPIVMMLRARGGEAQRVLQQSLRLSPSLQASEFRDVFDNRCDRLIAPAGSHFVRSEVVADVPADVPIEANAPRTPFEKLPDAALPFTFASRYCPSDKLQALARDVTRGCRPGYAEVQAIRDYVHDQLTYRYGVSNASTDAVETLEARAGVCRDFAHVAITLCRSIDIPARMVVGYLYGLEPMDMHAWFEAHVGGRWYAFDASEDELRGGRIVIAHGRDAADVAFLTDYGALSFGGMRVTVDDGPVRAALPVRLREAG